MSNREKRTMASHDLPTELIFEIFSRLPARSVGKYNSLSKYWSIHLSKANFIKKHLIARKLPKQSLALVTTETENVYIFEDINSSGKRLPDECKTDNVLGSCNGMILLDGPEDLLLVNPITLENVIIPHTHFVDPCYGFGYDSIADDYKVVALNTASLLAAIPAAADDEDEDDNGDDEEDDDEDEDEDDNDDQEQDTTSVLVYSLKTSVWKRVEYPYGELLWTQCEGGAFLSGALHWFVWSREEPESETQRFIAAFDLATEDFRKIPVLTDMGWKKSDCDIFVVGGCLCVLGNQKDATSNVWILKEYRVATSWVQYSIQGYDDRESVEPVIDEWDSIFALLCYNEDGELLFLTGLGYLFAYNLEQRTVRKVIHEGFDSLFDRGMAFVDSLVSPK